MVISHKYEYLFVELPRTGSTAISKELCEQYSGYRILSKHATYNRYLRIASPKEKKYFVFSCIRNPLDRTLSLYFKLKNDHKGQFSNMSKSKSFSFVKYYFLRRYKFIKKNNADFSAYFMKYYKIPYNDWSCLYHKKFDFIIRFENIQEDFFKALRMIGIEPKRPLPFVNKTEQKMKNFFFYYTKETISRAKRIFGPFMKEWGYEFPSEWKNNDISIFTYAQFYFFNIFRKFYWKYIK